MYSKRVSVKTGSKILPVRVVSFRDFVEGPLDRFDPVNGPGPGRSLELEPCVHTQVITFSGSSWGISALKKTLLNYRL